LAEKLLPDELPKALTNGKDNLIDLLLSYQHLYHTFLENLINVQLLFGEFVDEIHEDDERVFHLPSEIAALLLLFYLFFEYLFAEFQQLYLLVDW
jgi:hypothetical protein